MNTTKRINTVRHKSIKGYERVSEVQAMVQSSLKYYCFCHPENACMTAIHNILKVTAKLSQTKDIAKEVF